MKAALVLYVMQWALLKPYNIIIATHKNHNTKVLVFQKYLRKMICSMHMKSKCMKTIGGKPLNWT